MSQSPQQSLSTATPADNPALTKPADGAIDEESPRGVLQILREIKTGSLDPKILRAEDRQACVMHLGLEGATVPEMGQLLGVSDRTIARDRRAIQQQHAIHADPALAPLVAGRLMQEAETSNARLRRIGRDPQTPPAVKVASELAAYEVYDKFAQRLQSLGILPQMTPRLHADVTHHTGDLTSLDDLRRELDRIDSIEHAGASMAPSATISAPVAALASMAKESS
ncbi:MAG: hypothetical protein IT443_06600 [Phycisphaeraceae bacterium]|nr:hypothetical protein [Phycisphaeraceae bacterium]